MVAAITFRKVLYLISFTIICAVALGFLYGLQTHFPLDSWFFIACVNTVLSFTFAAVTLSEAKNLRPRAFASFRMTGAQVAWFLPSLSFLAVIGVAALVSRFVGSPTGQPLSNTWVALVLWVPAVEEIVYRGAFGRAFRKLGGPFWGGYFSALFFSLMHTLPTWDRVLALQIGLPLGPLLLGIICEYLYFKSGRILVPIAFHAVANFSVVVFSLSDSRWFAWLDFLYS
ncbi:MAG: lysostaphin resistance A-like protein [Oligoflexales bacterium]